MGPEDRLGNAIPLDWPAVFKAKSFNRLPRFLTNLNLQFTARGVCVDEDFWLMHSERARQKLPPMIEIDHYPNFGTIVLVTSACGCHGFAWRLIQKAQLESQEHRAAEHNRKNHSMPNGVIPKCRQSHIAKGYASNDVQGG